jgi:hypothetical protein
MSIETIQHLGAEFGQRFFDKALSGSSEAKAIYKEMGKHGLTPQPERSHIFNLFSPVSLKSISISITPFSSKDLSFEGGLSISEGGHAQGVIVEMRNRTEIVGFTHIAVTRGKVVTSKHQSKELLRGRTMVEDGDRIKAIAERVGKVKAAKPLVEIEAHQVRSLASVAYNALLSDRFSATVHSESEITTLRSQTDLVAQIGLFALFRTSGSACCSCSCSCWGSSSCSCSFVG